MDGKFWREEIAGAQELQREWCDQADRILERYRQEKKTRATRKRFNILWSNIQTLKPAVYSRRPEPEVSRRHKDKDPVGRLASDILERALIYESEMYADVHRAVDAAVLDELLVGRGTAWVRYEAEFVQTGPTEGEPNADPDKPDESADSPGSGYGEELQREYACVEYVFWKDFLHSPARNWSEVRWVARRTFLTRDKLVERFGDVGKRAPLTHEPKGREKADERHKQAVVWEVWHKASKRTYWVCEAGSQNDTGGGFDGLLDERDDYLQLDGFWPCPQPLSMGMSSGSMIPVPDYVQYEDQAKELDNLTNRIDRIVDAIRANGIYNGAEKTIPKILQGENTLVPVESWAVWAERGGARGQIEWLPVDTLANVLQVLYDARERTKQTIYEITGLADVIRGSSNAAETATAQAIKGKFASLRLTDRQNAVASFASQCFRLKAEIMATKYRPETLLEMAAVDQMIGMQPAPQQAMPPDAQGMQPMPAGPDPMQLIQQAMALLAQEPARQFRIEVNADSFVQLDEQQEKQDRTEFLQAMGGFMQSALPIAAQVPELGPVVTEMISFAARGFKAGRQLETVLDEAMARLNAPKPQQPQGPPPEVQVEQMRQQAEQAKAQMQMQIEQAKLQAQMQADQMRMQADQQKAQMQAEIDERRMQAEAVVKQRMAEQEANLKITLADRAAAASLQQAIEVERIRQEAESQRRAMTESMRADTARERATEASDGAA